MSWRGLETMFKPMELLTARQRRIGRLWRWPALLLGLLLLASIVAAVVASWRPSADPPVVIGRVDDFPPGSVTALNLATSIYDPMRPPIPGLAGAPSLIDRVRHAWQLRFRPSIGQVSPVPIFLVHDAGGVWLALYNRDTHSSCRMVWLPAVQRDAEELFVDPCHGSAYTRHGDYVKGPAPRGLDRFPVMVTSDGEIVMHGTTYIGP
jgi:nitrite reductase/ring-hydroxylating ferredoxin subunit